MCSPPLLVVGSYATALVMETERLPLGGETLIGRNYREVHGGKGSNQAVQAARLGAEVSFLSRVGSDSHGEALLTLMKEEDVGASAVISDPEHPTGVGFIVVDEQGGNMITLDMGANKYLSSSDIQEACPRFRATAAVLTQMEIPLETALEAMRQGRKAGAITLLNPAPAVDLRDQDLSCVDYLLPNETEARVCAGLPADASIAATVTALCELGCGHVIITLGEEGCLYASATQPPTRVPGFKVKALDSVGAGDSFCAAFTVALSEGKSLEAALRFGHAAAALSVTKPDTIPSYPLRDDVERLLREAK